MREKNLLFLFLVLNIALAGAFVTYLFLSNNGQPAVVATNFPSVAKVNLSNTPASAPVKKVAMPASGQTNIASTNLVAEATPPKPKPTWANKKFSWEDIQSAEYLSYIESLRAVGCPEEKVRVIVLSDINELFAKKKLKSSVEMDQKWWQSESQPMMVNVLQEKGRRLEEERRELIARLLGPETDQREIGEPLLWSSIQLTGPVLGNLSPKVHNEVQEICARALDRQQSYSGERSNSGQLMNQVEMAKMREQTRIDLRKVLGPDEVEEFILRYSYNAHNLRIELRGLDPTPEEFRKVFRAVDSLEHQMQLEYGGVEAMGEKQRERYQRQREAAIREALAPHRYQAYLMTKDPLYQQAQMTAQQFNAPPKALVPIYQMTKVNESKRQRILKDASLSPQQKSEAINEVNQEHQKSIQQIVIDAATKP